MDTSLSPASEPEALDLAFSLCREHEAMGDCAAQITFLDLQALVDDLPVSKRNAKNVLVNLRAFNENAESLFGIHIPTEVFDWLDAKVQAIQEAK